MQWTIGSQLISGSPMFPSDKKGMQVQLFFLHESENANLTEIMLLEISSIIKNTATARKGTISRHKNYIFNWSIFNNKSDELCSKLRHDGKQLTDLPISLS